MGESISGRVKARRIDYREVGAILQQKIRARPSLTRNRRIKGSFLAFYGVKSEESDSLNQS